MKKKTGIVLAALLCILLWGCAAETAETTEAPTTLAETEAPTTEATTEPTTQPTEPEPERFVLTFVGDCTLGCNESHSYMGYGFVKTIGEDYGWPFRNVIEYFENDDFTMINLEGPLTDTYSAVGKKHVFRGPESYINILTQNSIEAVTLANNHAEDHGKQGYETTRELLDGAEIPYVERDSSTIITTESGLTIGLYASVYYVLDQEVICEEIAKLAENEEVDLVIYVPHWGYEHTYRPYEAQVELAHAVIDAGADIIYGSHPHVLQPIEEYGDGIIYYSLANFSFGGNIYPGDYDTALVQQEVIREPDGTVHLGELTIVPCNVSSVSDRNNFQPTPYEEGSEEYARTISKLDGTFTGPNLPVG